jgi:hypothetical protein
VATIALGIVTPNCTISGNSPQTLVFPEASSQSFKRGEPVYLASGKVTEIASNTPSQILGFAAQDASGTVDTDIAVWLANDDTLFEANVTDAGSSAVSAVTDVGCHWKIYRDTSNSKLYIDKGTGDANVADCRITVLQLSGKDTVGDTYGRELFQVNALYRQLARTS